MNNKTKKFLNKFENFEHVNIAINKQKVLEFLRNSKSDKEFFNKLKIFLFNNTRVFSFNSEKAIKYLAKYDPGLHTSTELLYNRGVVFSNSVSSILLAETLIKYKSVAEINKFLKT